MRNNCNKEKRCSSCLLKTSFVTAVSIATGWFIKRFIDP